MQSLVETFKGDNSMGPSKVTIVWVLHTEQEWVFNALTQDLPKGSQGLRLHIHNH